MAFCLAGLHGRPDHGQRLTTEAGSVITRTLDDLQAPDEQTQHFTRYGLATTHILTPESAVAYQHELLTGTDLVNEVADGTRRSFERLRTVYIYGVLEYELFTVAGQFARLVVEQALRDRFLCYHHDGITLVNPTTRQELVVQVESFDDVLDAFKQPGGPWKLKLKTAGPPMTFNGMLTHLWAWARRERLLPGQRARSLQRAQVKLRNMVAHPSGHSIGTPGDAALVIRDLAEIINCLWGHRTPGGRLHPAPVQRSVLLITWDHTGRIEIGDAHDTPSEHMAADSTCLVVRATTTDPMDLTEFDARFETTHYPTELLWGPGTPEDARGWLDLHQPDGDEVDHLDRHFMIRHHNGHLDPPRRPQVAAGLPDHEHAGTWALVKADDPLSAYNHVRNQTDPNSACTKKGPCPNCPAHTVARGTWSTLMQRAADTGLDVHPANPPTVRSPSILSGRSDASTGMVQ